MYRAVKRGSSGIGLIHTKKSYEKIDYVKSYFTLPADKMKQQRNMFRVM